MARPLQIVLLVLSAVTLVLAGHESWTYEGELGPDHWADLGFKNCDRHRQSPIAIETSSTVRKRMKPLEFYHFDEIPLTMNLTNNYHSAGATMTTRKVPMVRSGGLPGNFEVVGFHFHWGLDSTTGSEHTVNGRHYPLEMHVVCKNTDYEELQEALKHEDGLAVLAVMFELSEANNRAIGRLEEALAQITEGGSSVPVVDPPRLQELMPLNTNDFYRYEGSLTTPGCYEVVTWTIFQHPVKVTEAELELFRSLKRTEKLPIGHNYRTLQARYGRTVYLRRPEDEEDIYYDDHDEHELLDELHKKLLEEEIALLQRQRGGGPGLRPTALTALVAAVIAAVRL
ncbi:putative carbonic anhydrase 3 [Amphibalanus amphitrite]|uniref:putative carbonic anhydrase 3 n=1 Tax=Amphibalanus amphitrite TaxID=1232801 RepID=UPI001C92AAB0|nr:putative carbonic anhydrase 3 [Amphibalanus amphitrite]